MPKVTVDGTEIDVPTGATVLQACELVSTDHILVGGIQAGSAF